MKSRHGRGLEGVVGGSRLLIAIWNAPGAVIQRQWCYAYLLHQKLHEGGFQRTLSYAASWTQCSLSVAVRLESMGR